MGLRDRVQRFRQDWWAAGEAVEAAERRLERQMATERRRKAERVAAGECDQYGCTRPARRGGKCQPCLGAIF